MLKIYNYDIVFQEIPDEVTLAVNISGCPCRCPGCHSPHLWEDTGEALDEKTLQKIYSGYSGEVSCIALMGGDGDHAVVERLCAFIKKEMKLKSAWYSGWPEIPPEVDKKNFNYIKTGPYVASLGGLRNRTTNQRLYRVVDGRLDDITFRFWK